ncbi:MAG: class I SAM-dependent RNA methyltransferase [Gemmatimonadales bacterium]
MNRAVRIQAIAAGGDGVGTLADGRVVFIPRTAPGDLVELGAVRLTRTFARARLARLVEASPHRVAPPCPHYVADACGGCQLQHLNPETQREARRRLVGDALRRIGRLDVDDPPIEPSEAEFGYRAKITLTVGSVLGTRRSAGPGAKPPASVRSIGYHPLGRPDQVFDLTRCPIARAELNVLWARLRRHRELLPRDAKRLVLRVDRESRCHIIVKTAGSGLPTGRAPVAERRASRAERRGPSAEPRVWTRARELALVLEEEGTPAVLWWEPAGGAARVLHGGDEAYPATVFEQVHPAMGDRVRQFAVEQLGELPGRQVWDLYAGIGETTEAILRRSGGAATVESVEVNPRAVRLAERRGPAGATRIAGRVEDVLHRLEPAQAAILNPPRTGLAQAVAEHLTTRPPDRLVYISCDPATLARDLNRLAAAYRIVAIRAFDLFPQTAHVETVVTLVRR